MKQVSMDSSAPEEFESLCRHACVAVLVSPSVVDQYSSARSTCEGSSSLSHSASTSGGETARTSRLMQATAASAVTSAQQMAISTKRKTEVIQLRVRLKATADMPQRTVWMKQSSILRDIEANSPKVYIPGLMLLQAAAACPCLSGASSAFVYDLLDVSRELMSKVGGGLGARALTPRQQQCITAAP